MKKNIARLITVTVIAIVCLFHIFNVIVFFQVLNNANDSQYLQLGKVEIYSEFSKDNEGLSLTPATISLQNQDQFEISIHRSVYKPDVWQMSYSIGHVYQWEGQDPYLQVVEINYSRWGKEPTSGFYFAITTENKLSVWYSTYVEGHTYLHLWNPIEGWHQPEVRG